jgi:hypothetical protein
MSIRRLLENRVFGPDETRAMGEAFEIICDLLELKSDTDDPLTRKIAQAIIDAAEAGVRDAEGLMAAALDMLQIPRGPSGESSP